VVPRDLAVRHVTRCPAVDALAQRESIDDLVIPGVTAVDPALTAYAVQPLRLPRPGPSKSPTGRAIVEAILVAADYLGAGSGVDEGPRDLASVGRPSDAALLAVERPEPEDAIASPDPQASEEPPVRRDTAPGV
jgi:hypothetical protein